MLSTTTKLIGYLNDKERYRNYSVIGSMIYAIIKCGSKEDADELLGQYLANPFDSKYFDLLSVFKKFGDSSYAEKLYDLLVEDDRLAEDADTEVLALLGHFHYEPAKKMLANYAFGLIDTSYYYTKDAIIGLLNFDCDEYQAQIREEIVKCYGQGLFSEFIPALVCKLHDRAEFLEPLYELGSKYASTDCNGGIVLGFSLCGEEGKKYFRKILFDPDWETYGGGTGTDHYTYKGLKNLGITFRELYGQVRQITDKKELEYALSVLLAMVRKRIYDRYDQDIETFSEIYQLLFGWKNENESDNIHDLIKFAGEKDRQEAYEFERLLKLKMTEEAILDNYTR